MAKKNKRKQFKQFTQETEQPLGVDVKLSGFPVKIGKLDFFFSTAEEHIDAFLRIYENPEAIEQKIEELRQKDLEEYKDGVPTREQFLQSVEYKKAALRELYDIILSPGSFDTLYSEYPDVNALASILYKVLETIDKSLGLWAEKQAKLNKEAEAKALIAKNKKRGVNNAVSNLTTL